MQSSYCRSLDVMSKKGKMILAFPVLDLSWSVYRLSKSASQSKLGQMMLAAFLFVVGIPFMWLVDMICIARTGRIAWFRDKYEEGLPLSYFKDDTVKTGKKAQATLSDEEIETII